MQNCNLFLDSLSPGVQARLAPYWDQVNLAAHTVLFEADEKPKHVHFLLSGIASLVAGMEDGELVEVGLLGNEGFPEYLHLLGPQIGTTQCIMQMQGFALRMSYERFHSFFLTTPELMLTVHRLVQYQALVLAQMGACNRLHSVSARLARWLLMVYDRVQDKELSITQEGLAAMIGSRRASVNIAAGALQEQGPIEYTRGKILIRDPAQLQTFACDCYPIVHDLFLRLYR